MSPVVNSKISDPALVEWRRAQIISAAIELFGRHGYHVTKMRDIAEKAGVSIGLIYQYVDEKEDVLFLALEVVLASYLREIPAAVERESDPLARFRAAVHAYCRVNDANTDATVLAYRETKSLAYERRNLIKEKELETNELIAGVIRDCIGAGLLQPVDVELLVYQIVMFSHAWALKAWHFRSLMTVNEYVERGLNLMLNSTLTARGKDAYRLLARQPLPDIEPIRSTVDETAAEGLGSGRARNGRQRRKSGHTARSA